MASKNAQSSSFESHTDYFHLTTHAKTRMAGRAISRDDINMVMTYGRISHVRGAVIYAIGHKEVAQEGILLRNCQGIHVVCSLEDGSVITTYRNSSLRGLRH
jgi:predicted aconitase with swiveling domain